MNVAVPVACALAAITGLALLRYGQKQASRCQCGSCRAGSPPAPWKLRAWALVLPGPGRAARIRHGLGRAEYAERVLLGMSMNHPDWITGELPDWHEELLAEMDAELEDMP